MSKHIIHERKLQEIYKAHTHWHGIFKKANAVRTQKWEWLILLRGAQKERPEEGLSLNLGTEGWVAVLQREYVKKNILLKKDRTFCICDKEK